MASVSKWIWSCLSVFLVVICSAASSFSGPLEVVQSVPLETTLAVPGVRQTQQVWLEMIGAAQHSLDFEEFYVSNKPGEALDPVLQAVRAAAGRGVQVRFVLDSKFYALYPHDADQLSQVPNITVETVDYSAQGGVQHSKYFVVDQTEAFLGSANLDWLALSHIHEVGVRIADSGIAAGLESIFAKDWSAGTPVGGSSALKTSLTPVQFLGQGDSSMHLIASPPSTNPAGMPDSLSAITQLIDSAKASLKIQVYEYSTHLYQSAKRWTVLDTALRRAASRGVRVQLLVDAVALKAGKQDLRALASTSGFEVRVVRIPQWSGGPLANARLVHSKYFVVDDTAGWVGTENWSGDYFMNSRNVGVTVDSPDTIGTLNQIFSQVWNSAYVSAP